MTGKEYRDLIAGYLHANFATHGIVVYTEVTLGKTIIGKDRRVDVFVVRQRDQKAIAIECKYQDSKGTVDEKIPYALQDLEALRVPGCLVYAGDGWSSGVLHTLAASRLAAYCMPGPLLEGVPRGLRGEPVLWARTDRTFELDHALAATFGLWDLILPSSRIFVPSPT